MLALPAFNLVLLLLLNHLVCRAVFKSLLNHPHCSTDSFCLFPFPPLPIHFCFRHLKRTESECRFVAFNRVAFTMMLAFA